MSASLGLEFAFAIDVRYIYFKYFFKYRLLGNQQMDQRTKNSLKNG